MSTRTRQVAEGAFLLLKMSWSKSFRDIFIKSRVRNVLLCASFGPFMPNVALQKLMGWCGCPVVLGNNQYQPQVENHRRAFISWAIRNNARAHSVPFGPAFPTDMALLESIASHDPCDYHCSNSPHTIPLARINKAMRAKTVRRVSFPWDSIDVKGGIYIVHV